MLSWRFLFLGCAVRRQDFLKSQVEQDVAPGEEHEFHEVGDGDDEENSQ